MRWKHPRCLAYKLAYEAKLTSHWVSALPSGEGAQVMLPSGEGAGRADTACGAPMQWLRHWARFDSLSHCMGHYSQTICELPNKVFLWITNKLLRYRQTYSYRFIDTSTYSYRYTDTYNYTTKAYTYPMPTHQPKCLHFYISIFVHCK